MNNLAQHFLLDPNVIYLNHGSFGATPRSVFEAYQAWQRRLERQPVKFLQRELDEHLAAARHCLADYVAAAPADLIFTPNPTFGVNTVVQSLALGPEDEVLTSNHEYGACINAWTHMSQKRGFKLVQRPLPWPITTSEEIVKQFWAGVTPNTKIIFLSHITSATALTLPVAEICGRAREAGILVFIDGAHVPGQLELNLAELAPDFYVGAGHKWLCAPKGVSFLYTRRELQPLIEPLIIGWGWGEDRQKRLGSDYLDNHQWLGTNDLSAYLSLPAAVAFQNEHNWTAVRQQCHELVQTAIHQISEVTGRGPVYPNPTFYRQMGLIELPGRRDLVAFKARLYDEYRIEIPCHAWNGRDLMRLSIQGYNSADDVAALVEAMHKLL